MSAWPLIAASSILAAGVAVPATAAPASADGCRHRPGFTALEGQAAARTPDALARAYAYAADPANDDPEGGCEAEAVDRLIGQLEIAAVSLQAAGRRYAPSAAFHCTTFDPRTTRCDGLVADGTGQPAGSLTGLRPPAPARATMSSSLGKEAGLVGLYRTTIGAVLDGRAAVPLGQAPMIRLGAAPRATVVIALFRAPAPYRYRKLVWYFR